MLSTIVGGDVSDFGRFGRHFFGRADEKFALYRLMITVCVFDA